MTNPSPTTDRTPPESRHVRALAADVDVIALAAQLSETSANLAEYIEERAREIAEPKVAEARAMFDEVVAESEERLAAAQQRSRDLADELRKQLQVLEKREARLNYAARHLPPGVRAAAGIHRNNLHQPAVLALINPETRDRIDRAANQAEGPNPEVERLRTLLDEVLGSFQYPGHPSEPCLRTGWVPVARFQRWRTAVRPAPHEVTDGR